MCFAGKWTLTHPYFAQVDDNKLNGSKQFPNGGENRRFCVIRIYDTRFEADKGRNCLWVPYSQGQLTTDPPSDSLKAKVS